VDPSAGKRDNAKKIEKEQRIRQLERETMQRRRRYRGSASWRERRGRGRRRRCRESASWRRRRSWRACQGGAGNKNA
jgi:hypothetical protein